MTTVKICTANINMVERDLILIQWVMNLGDYLINMRSMI